VPSILYFYLLYMYIIVIGVHFIHYSCLVWSLGVNQSESFFLSGGEDSLIKLWFLFPFFASLCLCLNFICDRDLDSNSTVFTFEGHSSGVRSLAFLNNSAQFASASLDKTVRIWDLEKSAFLTFPWLLFQCVSCGVFAGK
jgi:WD40 repeat protein